ncbi:MAG: hypothetical protein ACI93R_003582, partial [Flavobacteriales bacterium]
TLGIITFIEHTVLIIICVQQRRKHTAIRLNKHIPSIANKESDAVASGSLLAIEGTVSEAR